MPTIKLNKLDFPDEKLGYSVQAGVETKNGGQTSKNRDKYNISQTTYPEGLGVDPDKQHYIVFYINQRKKSKFSNFNPILNTKTSILKDVKISPNSNRIDPKLTAKAGKQGLILGGASGAGLASAVSDIASGESVFGGLVKGATIAGTVAVAGNYTLGEGTEKDPSTFFEADKIQRISDAIVLHIQDRPVTRHNVNYEETQIGALGGILGGGLSATDGMENAAFNDDVRQAVTRGIIGAAPGILGSRGGDLLELGTKQITNPFREQFFKSVDFRTHSFRYNFMAKSQEESKNIRHIIRLFKFHMHPELTGSGLSFIYPSEFDIKYYFKDKENKAFDRITSCVLTNMNIEYGGDIFSTFSDGRPVEVNMTLEFRELEVLTKKRIAEGF